MKEFMDTEQENEMMSVLVLPLRDVVVFPGNVMPLFVGREKSIQVLNEAMESDKQIFLVTQKNAELDDPTIQDLYSVGTMANILQLLKLPDGTVKVLVEGVKRHSLLSLRENDGLMVADISPVSTDDSHALEQKVLLNALAERFGVFSDLKKKVPSEVKVSVQKETNPDRVVDLISSNLKLSVAEKQTLLELTATSKRLEKVLAMIETEIEILESEKRITSRVKKQMDKTQREYYLNEKIKAIHSELAGGEESVSEHDELAEKIHAAGLTEQAKNKADAELKKLKMMPTQSSEATVVRNYLEWLLDIPWKKRSRVSKDLNKAEKILDAQHFGLEKVKERIVEYLAVQQRVRKLKGPILCLVGPPGVGKTSLAKSIAEATNRKYVRMALGGVRDEAEIRGHRKTYIGALPGKIIQKMQAAGTKNPLFLLDEIDKMSSDMRGDPASALLEVLDPEQNHAFNDHYLEVDYDLSDVMFVATSNSMDIPEALLDRMEVINLAGYTEQEKLHIAQRHLLPKAIKEHGIKEGELALSEEAITTIIQLYTREAGVRLLARELAKICRKAVKRIVTSGTKSKQTISVQPEDLEEYLGVARFRIGLADSENRIGQVAGLAWTRVGGDLLRIEATTMPGQGKLSSTGSLGSVMQESVEAAMSVIRSRSQALGLKSDFHSTSDLHLHFPEGATKKDGPSAGIAICTAILSAFTDIPVRADVAMTGEITLRGEVLPIGGLKEKLLAALRGGIKMVLIPHDNVRDLAEVPEEVKSQLDIQPVRWVDEVFELALTDAPKPMPEGDSITYTDETTVKSSEKASNHH